MIEMFILYIARVRHTAMLWYVHDKLVLVFLRTTFFPLKPYKIQRLHYLTVLRTYLTIRLETLFFLLLLLSIQTYQQLSAGLALTVNVKSRRTVRRYSRLLERSL